MQTEGRFNAGWALLYRGDLDEAVAAFSACLECPQFFEDDKAVAFCWFSLGSALAFLGEHDRGGDALRRSCAMFMTLHEPIEASMAFYVLGLHLLEDGDLAAARAWLERSFEQAQSVAYKSGLEKARAALAEVTLREGDAEGAWASFQASLAAMRGEAFVHPRLYQSGIAIAAARGDVQEAMRLVDEARPFARLFKAESAALDRWAERLSPGL
jgi:tetratricopeptide (TPR) repeat protein